MWELPELLGKNPSLWGALGRVFEPVYNVKEIHIYFPMAT